MKRRNFILYSLLFAAGCSAATDRSATKPDTLRFAVTDVQGLEELQRDFEPFREALAEVTGKKIDFFPVADRAAAAVALQSEQIDLVLTGPAEYVVIRARTNAVPLIAITRPNYRSVIAVRKDSGIKTLEELKGKKIAMSDVGSTSGHLGPSQILLKGGVNPQSDLKVIMLGDADLTAFQNGEVEAWGGFILDYERFMQANNLQESDFPIIKTGELLPSDVFVASSKLDSEYLEEIRDRLVENQDKLIAAIVSVSANQKYTDSKLIEAKDVDYDPIRKAYQAVGVTEFTQFIGD